MEGRRATVPDMLAQLQSEVLEGETSGGRAGRACTPLDTGEVIKRVGLRPESAVSGKESK